MQVIRVGLAILKPTAAFLFDLKAIANDIEEGDRSLWLVESKIKHSGGVPIVLVNSIQYRRYRAERFRNVLTTGWQEGLSTSFQRKIKIAMGDVPMTPVTRKCCLLYCFFHKRFEPRSEGV